MCFFVLRQFFLGDFRSLQRDLHGNVLDVVRILNIQVHLKFFCSLLFGELTFGSYEWRLRGRAIYLPWIVLVFSGLIMLRF